MRKKNIAGSITTSDFKTCQKVIVIKIAWYWHKNRHINKWNSIQVPETNPFMWTQLIFYKNNNTHIGEPKKIPQIIGAVITEYSNTKEGN